MEETLIAAKNWFKMVSKYMYIAIEMLIIVLVLEDFGCVAIMPLGASIGSGRGFDSINELEALRKKN